MEAFKKQNIIISWVVWQFYEMPDFLIQVWKNYLLFGLNYFSVHLLFKTLFSPWKRYNWRYPKGFDVGEFFNALVSNIFSRFLGFLFRIILIIVGILGQIVIFFGGAIAILIWVLIPFIIIVGTLFVFTF
ncbi:MAG: hypothetical protein Q8O66_00620 [bacterium]|nr:hypothetical protein [bacterium]